MPRDRDDDRWKPSALASAPDFKGWVPNADPHDLSLGASPDLVNAAVVKPGELRVRGGSAVMVFRAPPTSSPLT